MTLDGSAKRLRIGAGAWPGDPRGTGTLIPVHGSVRSCCRGGRRRLRSLLSYASIRYRGGAFSSHPTLRRQHAVRAELSQAFGFRDRPPARHDLLPAGVASWVRLRCRSGSWRHLPPTRALPPVAGLCSAARQDTDDLQLPPHFDQRDASRSGTSPQATRGYAVDADGGQAPATPSPSYRRSVRPRRPEVARQRRPSGSSEFSFQCPNVC